MKEKTRRSSRSLKQNVENTLPRGGRSRSTSANENTQRRSIKTTSITEKSPRKRKRGVSSSVEVPLKVPKITVGGRVIDAYCWVCHKLGSESICSSCPRVYHKDCLKKLKGNSNQSPFCECQLKTVDGKNEDLNLDVRELKKLLQYVMQEAIKEDKKNNHKSQRAESSKFCRLFQAWPTDCETLCKVMDLNILLDNMNGEEPYLSTGQFFMDVKWIYHNCCILYGSDNEVTEAALKLEKNFKLELTDMEACPECYNTKYSDNYLHADFFTKVCRNPHPIVWAKLRGSPFWPAKCLKIRNGHTEVRFFGTHDKSNIALDKCYRISKDNPLNKEIHQSKYQEAIRELSIYVSNYENMVGKFQYYPQKTRLENGNTSAKKNNRKGRLKGNKADDVPGNMNFSENENTVDPDDGFDKGSNMTKEVNIQILKSNYSCDDPVETKVKTSFQFLGNLSDNENNQNIAESVEEDIESNVLCHMTFTADEHNGPANELNNSEEFIHNSASHCSLSQASVNPSISLSLKETSSILSTAGLLSSDEYMTSAEQNSVDYLNETPLPVITSVSTDEMSLNPLPVITSAVTSNEIASDTLSDGLNPSTSFPVISSTTSANEKACFASKNIHDPDKNVKAPINDDPLSDSSSIPSLTRELRAKFNNFFEQQEEEIQIVNEESKTSYALDCAKNPLFLRVFSEVLLSSKPQLKESFFQFQSQILRYFMLLWVEIYFTRNDGRDVKIFFEVCKKYFRKNEALKRALAKAERAKSEAEKVRSEAVKAMLEAEKSRLKLEDELKELKKKIQNMGQGQIPNQKSELKDMIILKASQKIQNKIERNAEHHRTSENNLIQEIDSLSMQLEEARQKINIKEEDICKLREENERLKSSIEAANDKIDTCDSEVQTDESYFELSYNEIPEPDSDLMVDHSEDSSEIVRNSVHNLDETSCSSQELQSFTHSDVQVEMQSKTIVINSSMSSVSTGSALNVGVVQHVYEQNLLTSECTTMMTAPTAGVITSAPPTLVSVPVVLPPNPVIPPSGPIFLDAESSATFLNSMSSRKPKAKFGNQMKSSGKKKKNA